jgi:hypothetical protein
MQKQMPSQDKEKTNGYPKMNIPPLVAVEPAQGCMVPTACRQGVANQETGGDQKYETRIGDGIDHQVDMFLFKCHNKSDF